MNNEICRNRTQLAELVAVVVAAMTLALLTAEVRGASEDPSMGSPYEGQERRPIKSLSSKEITALRNGAGMGFAKLAELNHYPGPKHVLAVADRLDLSDKQRAESRAIYDDMHGKAVALGEKLIAAEEDLDRRFGDASIDEASLGDALRAIGQIRAELRYVHLEAHLKQRRLLSDEQVARYDEIRGYSH